LKEQQKEHQRFQFFGEDLLEEKPKNEIDDDATKMATQKKKPVKQPEKKRKNPKKHRFKSLIMRS